MCSDTELLWLLAFVFWLAATALTKPLAWEPPYAAAAEEWCQGVNKAGDVRWHLAVCGQWASLAPGSKSFEIALSCKTLHSGPLT